jgi:1,4-dihydroxy-2-naphthoate octaprenyltransferase
MPEPSTTALHRQTVANRLLSLALVTRPAFLTASILPVLTALAASWHWRNDLDWGVAVLTLAAVALIHSGANVLNDYCDARNGTDSHNRARIYPFSGGSRFIQNHIYTEAEVLRIAVVLLGAGGLCGLLLVFIGGPLVLALGVTGGLLAIAYSAPPCLACRGIGDAVIAACFGILPMATAVYLQLGWIPASTWWLGAAVGLFTAAILWVNSIPDIEADRRAGKWTLPARLGPARARRGLWGFFITGFGILALSPIAGELRLTWLAALPALLASRYLVDEKLLAAIPLTLVTHAAVCVLLIVDFIAF